MPKKYQKGGTVQGPSHERGGVKAKVGGKKTIELEGGEFVVNKEATKIHRDKLEKINNDKTAKAKLKPLPERRQGSMARKGGNIAKDPKTGKKKKVKHASNVYRKGGIVKYPGMICD